MMNSKKTFFSLLLVRMVLILAIFFIVFYSAVILFVQLTGKDDRLNPQKSQVVAEVNETAQIEPFSSRNDVSYAVGVNCEGKIIFKDTQEAFRAFKNDDAKRLREIGLKNGLIYLNEKNWKMYKKPAFLTGSSPGTKQQADEVRAFFTYYSNSFD